MNKKMKFLTLQVALGIYGVAPGLHAEDTAAKTADDPAETMVVTAAQQNLQAPGVSDHYRRRNS